VLCAVLAQRTAAIIVPIAGAEAELLVAQPPLEIVDETPAGANDDMDLDAPLWEHDANEKYMDTGERVGIEGDLDVETMSKTFTAHYVRIDACSPRVKLTIF
jgi:hypothetical protein